jgi:hypothetical protein
MSNATPINPFPSVAAELTSPQAVAFYKSLALECFYCFGTGLLVLMAGTVRAGQILRELIHAGYQTILEMNQSAPTPVLALAGVSQLALPATTLPHPDRLGAENRQFRQAIKEVQQQCAEWGHAIEGVTMLIPPAVIPAAAQEVQPTPRRRGRKPKAVA